MHELPLLINIAVALTVAFLGGLVTRRMGLPTIIGYLLAGILIGPFTPGLYVSSGAPKYGPATYPTAVVPAKQDTV
jgi:CPA2 family monovalent cation:H+ antiporter-2